MRRTRNFGLATVLFLLGLIAVSVLVVLVADAGALASPTIPFGGSGTSSQGPTGYLVVDIFSNTNENSRLSLPSTNSTYPVGQWPVTVTNSTHSAGSVVVPLITDPHGGAEQTLSAGNYTVGFSIESLTVQVPVTVQAQKVTRAIINITGNAFPITYSEESPGTVTESGFQSSMFVRVAGPSPIAAASKSVVIKSQGAMAGTGRFENATVVSELTGQGVEWLQLATQQPFNPVNATSIYLTTWAYSSLVTTSAVGPNGYSVDVGN